MANYVANRIVCTKIFFEDYLLDPYSLGQKDFQYCKDHKYISFNKLFGDVRDIDEYREKYGRSIYYGDFYTINDLSDGKVEIKFKTRWKYPISAILKAIEIDHSIVWYASEESIIYISKFLYANGQVIEKTLYIEDEDFGNWYDIVVDNTGFYDKLDLADDVVWHYNYEARKDWNTWESDNLIQRYKDKYPAHEYYDWLRKNE